MIPFIFLLTKNAEEENFLISAYREYQRLMYYIADRFTSNPQEQEEIVQTAILKMVRSSTKLRSLDEQALAGYIGTLTKNTAINHMKHIAVVNKHIVSSVPDDSPLISSSQYLPESFVIRMERRELIREVLDHLTESERILIEGKYILDMSDTELAEIIGCKPRSITMMLTRAKRHAIDVMNRIDQDDKS